MIALPPPNNATALVTPGSRSLPNAVAEALTARWRALRTLPISNPAVLLELMREKTGHRVHTSYLPHLNSAVDWLGRAQDATNDDGFARGYSLLYNHYFRRRGWEPSYPETTGYIIPTLFEASDHLDRPELADRAIRAARWESAIQLESGAVQGGVIGQGQTPAVFNTGQVIFGWLAAFARTGESSFAESARRAGRYLVSVLESDGHWRKGNSSFARTDTTLYNARVAWALAEAGVRLREPSFTDAAARNLRAVMREQHENGWIPNCCLDIPSRPLLHTLAYATRGLLEGGRVLQDDAMVRSAARTARALQQQVRHDGWMPGRFNADWTAAAEWSCLTGQAQMANNWMRLHLITGDSAWLDAVPRVLTFLKRTQNTTTGNDGLRGGIKGSFPMSGVYGRFEVLNWATKYFVDALVRHEQISGRPTRPASSTFDLA